MPRLQRLTNSESKYPTIPATADEIRETQWEQESTNSISPLFNRTSTFLSRADVQLFEPRGLFAMVMTFKPEQQSQIVDVDSSSPSAMAMRGVQGLGLSRTRNEPNTTYGELQLPPSAPLIFPTVDSKMAGGAQQHNGLKGVGHFTADYFDQRAQAKYVRLSDFRLCLFYNY
jgi:hypothetical protein